MKQAQSCDFPPCTNHAEVKGLCAHHHRQRLAGKPLKALPPEQLYENMAPCKVPSCQAAGIVKRLCRPHYMQMHMHGASMELLETLASGKAKCQICDSTSKLCIDHDHNCCPSIVTRGRGGGCGKCIRGILCYYCNLLITKADENVAYLTRMQLYLAA